MISCKLEDSNIAVTSYKIRTSLSCKLQDMYIAKLQDGRYEHWLVASCNIGTLLSSKSQDERIPKL